MRTPCARLRLSPAATILAYWPRTQPLALSPFAPRPPQQLPCTSTARFPPGSLPATARAQRLSDDESSPQTSKKSRNTPRAAAERSPPTAVTTIRGLRRRPAATCGRARSTPQVMHSSSSAFRFSSRFMPSVISPPPPPPPPPLLLLLPCCCSVRPGPALPQGQHHLVRGGTARAVHLAEAAVRGAAEGARAHAGDA